MPETENKYINDILGIYKVQLAAQFQSYRNHAYRVYNLTMLLSDENAINKDELAIAAAFHDIGIWTDATLDYLGPSVALARSYLSIKNLPLGEVENLISYHHKISSYKCAKVVEDFRRADLADLSFGLIDFGVKQSTFKELYRLFPTLGFQRFIFYKVIKHAILHPFDPAPMMKI